MAPQNCRPERSVELFDGAKHVQRMKFWRMLAKRKVNSKELLSGEVMLCRLPAHMGDLRNSASSASILSIASNSHCQQDEFLKVGDKRII
jgi:hypothetical protein